VQGQRTYKHKKIDHKNMGIWVNAKKKHRQLWRRKKGEIFYQNWRFDLKMPKASRGQKAPG